MLPFAVLTGGLRQSKCDPTDSVHFTFNTLISGSSTSKLENLTVHRGHLQALGAHAKDI